MQGSSEEDLVLVVGSLHNRSQEFERDSRRGEKGERNVRYKLGDRFHDRKKKLVSCIRSVDADQLNAKIRFREKEIVHLPQE